MVQPSKNKKVKKAAAPVNPKSLQGLPGEVLSNISTHMDGKSLKNLRLTNRRLSAVATRSLFSRVRLTSCGHSITPYLHLISTGHHGLSRHVRKVTFDTRQDKVDVSWVKGPHREEYFMDMSRNGDISSLYQPLIRGIHKEFPELQAVELLLGNASLFDNDPLPDNLIIESMYFGRVPFMQAFFEGLADRKSSPVRSITITNLSTTAWVMLPGYAALNATIKQLYAVHVLLEPVLQRITVRAEDEDYTDTEGPPEQCSQAIELRTQWIDPIKHQLTALTIYQHSAWGAFPDFEIPDLPVIKSLALGKYLIGHKSQQDWLVSMKTLESLTLDGCSMVWLLTDMITAERLGLQDEKDWYKKLPEAEHEVHDSLKVVYDEESLSTMRVLQHEARWSGLFDVLRSELPKLKSFSFGSGSWDSNDWHDDEAFLERYTLKTHCQSDRYTVFHGVKDDGKGNATDLDSSASSYSGLIYPIPSTAPTTLTFRVPFIDSMVSSDEFETSLHGSGKHHEARVCMPPSTNSRDAQALGNLLRAMASR